MKRSHSVNVHNLIQKIENHPQRHALQSDLQQHRQFNPFSKESRDVLREVGNVELCGLLDVEPKAKCKMCLSYWDVGIVYCTCEHFLRKGTEENQKFVQYTIRKDDSMGTVTGRNQGTESTTSPIRSRRNARRDISWVSTTGSSETEKFRKNMIDNGLTEETCRQMDNLADEDHTHHRTQEEIEDF